MGTFNRARRPLVPLAIWAMTTALAYVAGKRRRDESQAPTGMLRRRKPARAAKSAHRA